ncbi:hypothetical protein QYE76_056148 [Lolium multiflorum]|uniref:SOSEKI DIX-like domain-containing protein n=1 Tax=Lolium multiflorum TaxID=4521 RepID=A0AAD8WMJ7_LOLMU|nr:hypothetical protein QYE76_056148 [Lolium multiflorum]
MDSYKGGGEARRVINVVYFLSRGGRTDQPHLFRVNLSHLHRAGVRLRDVKRWLSEVRGKDMPGNFSWSYKRKYKSGYVWQDLLDDDLITPISDNEYVLKGCDVRRTPPPCSEAPKHFPIDEKKLNRKGSWERKQAEEVLQVQVTRDYDEGSPKPPPPIDQASPVGAEGNPAPFRIVLPQDLLQRRQREAAVRSTTKSTDQQQQQQALVLAARPAAAAMGGEKQQRPAVGSARRVRVAQVLHSILTCGAADGVDDAAHRPIVPRHRAGAVDDDDGWQRTPFCPGMDGCGISMSRKVKLQRGGGGKDGKAKRDGGRRDRVAAAHKPATLPRCSQCGKGFKPQELHSHMQSCRGLRERMRSSARMSVDRSQSSTAKADHSSTDRPHTVFLLTES